MKLAFVVPPPEYNCMNNPIDRVYGCNYGYDYKPPIHMLQVATVLEKEGHEIRFLDCPAEGWKAPEFEQWVGEGDFDAAIFFTPYLAEEEDKRAAAKIREVHGTDKKIVFFGAAALAAVGFFGVAATGFFGVAAAGFGFGLCLFFDLTFDYL